VRLVASSEQEFLYRHDTRHVSLRSTACFWPANYRPIPGQPGRYKTGTPNQKSVIKQNKNGLRQENRRTQKQKQKEAERPAAGGVVPLALLLWYPGSIIYTTSGLSGRFLLFAFCFCSCFCVEKLAVLVRGAGAVGGRSDASGTK
jgi:hypothetical protein